MSIREVARRLRADARETNQRRLLVCRGSRRDAMDAALAAVRAAGYDDVTLVTDRTGFEEECVSVASASRLLGQTREAVVVDAFDDFSPNLLGRTVGAVAGGGLYVVVCPAWNAWDGARVSASDGPPDAEESGGTERPSDDFRESLAVPPFERSDVGTRFRERVVRSFDHPGVVVYDARTDRVVGERRTRDRGASVWGGGERAIHPPRDAQFPDAAYEACLTADQRRAVAALERLADPGAAVVIEANRGRGKSAAAGIAAGAMAVAGREVVVTAPEASGAAELLDRAAAVVEGLVADDEAAPPRGVPTGADRVVTAPAGWVAYVEPAVFAAAARGVDAAVVDEAAGLSVRRLEGALAAESAAFVTTIHGYEGAGRGFSVRFRDRLDESGLSVTDCRLREPIRHAPGDPVESWAFRTLALDAREPVAGVVRDATVESATYRRLAPETLASDERLLREVFGTLVTAHYRTEPDDLARLLDAPNLSVHALTHAGHVVSVALVAREGGLSPDVCRRAFTGDRIRGNLVPDLLTSQLRDPDAGRPVGYRIVRVATHASRRREGFASRLLDEIHDAVASDTTGTEASGTDGTEASDTTETEPSGTDGTEASDRTGTEASDDDTNDVADGGARPARFPPADYVGTAFGATPGLVAFWRENGYRTVHLSTTRGDASGEHSAVMLRPVTATGASLTDRHTGWFRDRIGSVATDALRDVDPDVLRAVIRACGADHEPLTDLSAYEWRVVVGAATGPGLYDGHPAPFRRLALAWLLDPETRAVENEAGRGGDTTGSRTGEGAPDRTRPTTLTAREERLLVRKVLQARPWDETADAEGYVSTGACMRALGEAFQTVVDRYGGSLARRERGRLE